MGKRGPKPRDYEVFQKRYPLALKEKFDEIYEKWLRERKGNGK